MSLRADNASCATVTVVTSAGGTELAAARPTRRQITFMNLDGTNFVWINGAGTTPTATAATHFKLLAGKQVTLVGTGQWRALADTGSVAVSVVDEYD